MAMITITNDDVIGDLYPSSGWAISPIYASLITTIRSKMINRVVDDLRICATRSGLELDARYLTVYDNVIRNKAIITTVY
jgi:hypothetical protein